jgi:hypothetical protein
LPRRPTLRSVRLTKPAFSESEQTSTSRSASAADGRPRRPRSSLSPRLCRRQSIVYSGLAFPFFRLEPSAGRGSPAAGGGAQPGTYFSPSYDANSPSVGGGSGFSADWTSIWSSICPSSVFVTADAGGEFDRTCSWSSTFWKAVAFGESEESEGVDRAYDGA